MRMTIRTHKNQDDMPPLTGLGHVVAAGFYKHDAPDGAMEIDSARGGREVRIANGIDPETTTR